MPASTQVIADPAVVSDVEAVLDQIVVPERGDTPVIGQSEWIATCSRFRCLADHDSPARPSKPSTCGVWPITANG